VTSPFSVMYKKLRVICGALAISVAATMAASTFWMYDSDQPVMRVSRCTAPKPNAQRLVLAFAGREPIARPRRPVMVRMAARKRSVRSVKSVQPRLLAAVHHWRFGLVGLRFGVKHRDCGFSDNISFAGEAHSRCHLVGPRKERLHGVADGH
jgi:hypothetical protein